MNRLKEARKSAGFTQAEVGQRIGVTQNAYSYWENGKSKFDNQMLSKLAELFSVSTDYLLGIDPPKEESTPLPPKDILEVAYTIASLSDHDRELIRELTASMVRLAEREQNGH